VFEVADGLPRERTKRAFEYDNGAMSDAVRIAVCAVGYPTFKHSLRR
jgi:hypothetical protein